MGGQARAPRRVDTHDVDGRRDPSTGSTTEQESLLGNGFVQEKMRGSPPPPKPTPLQLAMGSDGESSDDEKESEKPGNTSSTSTTSPPNEPEERKGKAPSSRRVKGKKKKKPKKRKGKKGKKNKLKKALVRFGRFLLSPFKKLRGRKKRKEEEEDDDDDDFQPHQYPTIDDVDRLRLEGEKKKGTVPKPNPSQSTKDEDDDESSDEDLPPHEYDKLEVIDKLAREKEEKKKREERNKDPKRKMEYSFAFLSRFLDQNGGRGPAEAVPRWLADEAKHGRHIGLKEFVAWGLRTRSFLIAGGVLYLFETFLEEGARGVMGDAQKKGGTTVAAQTTKLATYTKGTPVKPAEILKFGQDRGWYQQKGGKLVVDGVDQAELRKRALAPGMQESETIRFPTEKNRKSGWATVGMEKKNVSFDRDHGVTRYKTEEQRAHVFLQLERGRFVDSSRRLARGPDLSNKNNSEVWNTSPFWAGERYKQKNNDKSFIEDLNLDKMQEVADELRNAPRLIFAMDGKGAFYATEAKLFEIHHSTFMNGGSVACAGEIALTDGRPTYLSNASGHYKPGPAYVWQALKNMQQQGVNLRRVKVDLVGVKKELDAEWFLANFSPLASPKDTRYLSFDAEQAVTQIKKAIARSPEGK